MGNFILFFICWFFIILNVKGIEVNLYDQYFNQTYHCEKNQTCHFHCSQSYAPCLQTTFDCHEDSNCLITCDSTLACSFAKIICRPNASCFMNCTGTEWPCTFLQPFECEGNCGLNYTKVHVQFTASMGLMMVKTMAILGYRIRNSYMLQDGTMQGLCYELPQDTESKNNLFNSIPPVLEKVLAERSQKWQGPYDFTFDYAHPAVLRVHFTVEQLVLKTISNIMDEYDGIEITNAVFDPINVLFDLYFNYTGSVPISFAGPVLLEGLKLYFIDIFNYPNTSFITTVPDFSDLSNIVVRVYIPNYLCAPPAPFFGTYCWLNQWYSEGNIQVISEDLIASPTLSLHQGTLLVSNHLKLDNASLIITESLIINSFNGIFQIANSSLSPTKLEIYDSIIEFNGDSTIDTEELILEKATLRVVLSKEQAMLLDNEGSIEITGINALKIDNYFNDIEIVGNTSNSDCSLTTNQYKTDKRLVILIQAPDCNSNQVSPKLITTICVIIALGIALIISGIIVYKRKREIARTLKSIREQVNKEIN